MSDFFNKFLDPEWIRKRDEILKRAGYECEYCGETGTDIQVHICYYLKGREPWQLPDDAYRCYCPTHREARQRLETDLKMMLASFSMAELNPLCSAMEALSAIPESKRSVSFERIYVAAKRERDDANYNIGEDDETYDE